MFTHILPQILPQTTTTNHYHNWGVNIYYHTNFCSNPTICQFYHTFYNTFLPHILPQILPQTTIIIGESISTTTQQQNSQPDNFSILPHIYYTCYHNFYHKPLPLSPQTPTTFSVPRRNTYKCFERPTKICIASN